MKRKKIINCFLSLCLTGLVMPVSAQVIKNERLLSFEDGVPPRMEAESSSLSISDIHYKDGIHSLRWTYQAGATLTLKQDLKFEEKDPTGKDTYMSAFIVWVYNEKAVDKKIVFQFLKDGKECTSFPFGINFTGWRAAWVCYERDMEGIPELGMNELRVKAPDVEGELFIDHLITAVKVDARQQAADMQVPFVHEGTTNHWLVIYPHSLWTSDLPLTPVTEEEKADIRLMEKRFRELIYTPGRVTQKQLGRIRKQYDTYHIVYRNGKVSGLPIFMVRQSEAYERMIPDWDKDMFTKLGMEMKAYFDLMKSIATAYLNADEPEIKREMREKFMSMYDHITDQGVAYGSCWGNIHHYGYSVRNLYLSYFLMKDVLREEGRLTEAEATLRWYAITNEIYPKPEGNGIDMDSFNTQTSGRIASILIMEDTPEKLRYLRAFSRWIDYGCRPAPGLSGSFKSDGAAFHHCNNYPAYAVGGLDGAVNMIYLMSGTTFAVSELAHQTVKNVLLAMRFYCNRIQFPLSMSGRHPNGKGRLIPGQFGMMAISGSPDGKQKYDTDMASAYLRLLEAPGVKNGEEPDYIPQKMTGFEEKVKRELVAAGFMPEMDPQGNMAFGYGCISVQRRSNWAAVVRGSSRYLWSAEHYLDANFYGRYLGYGSMQVLTALPGQYVTFTTSGWQENGFDWNRIPGVTSIHLPFDKLRAKVLNVDSYSGFEEMLYSDEAFAGGLCQQSENGNFGMILHEHDKYNGSHRARISYHFFNDKIVALGSDIENTNTDYPTETTVFQLAAVTPDERSYWGKCEDGKQTYMTPNGSGYYVNGRASLIRNFPQVTVGERNANPTSGDWVSLVFEHGKSPKNASYEYAVLPQTSETDLEDFAKKPTYKVLRQDRNAHIVVSESEGLTSYVLFETPLEKLPGKWIEKTDTCCLAMVKEEDSKHIVLTVSQPDIALYRGPSDESFDNDGKRIERSIYSRPWKDNESQEIPVTVTLSGQWVPENLLSNMELVESDKKHTVLRFTCREGRSYDVNLSKK